MTSVKAYPFACGGASAGEHTCGKVAGCEGASRVEDVLVDRGAAVHLVRGDEPFVAPGEDVVGEFAAVGPPAISIIPKAEKAALLEGAKALVLLRGEVGVAGELAPVNEGVHSRSSMTGCRGTEQSKGPVSMSPCQWVRQICLRAFVAVGWRIRPSEDDRAGVNAGRWLAFPLEGGMAQASDGAHFSTWSLARRPRATPVCNALAPPADGMDRPLAASGKAPLLDISAAAIRKLAGLTPVPAPVFGIISVGSIGAWGITHAS